MRREQDTVIVLYGRNGGIRIEGRNVMMGVLLEYSVRWDPDDKWEGILGTQKLNVVQESRNQVQDNVHHCH